jgi:hypothetical protein
MSWWDVQRLVQLLLELDETTGWRCWTTPGNPLLSGTRYWRQFRDKFHSLAPSHYRSVWAASTEGKLLPWRVHYSYTGCLRRNALILSYRVSTIKRLDSIIQSVYEGTPWFYHTECLEWNALVSSYKVSTMNRLDSVIQSVYNETPWFHHTRCLQWTALILSYRVSTMERPSFIIQGVYNESPWIYHTQSVYNETP